MKAADPGSPEAFWAEAEILGRAVLAQLEYFEALGAAGLPVEIPAPAVRGGERTAAGAGTGSGRSGRVWSQPPSGGGENRAARLSTAPESPASAAASPPRLWAAECPSLEDLAERTGRCRACAPAPESPERPLFGRGSATPLMVVVGSDPSIYEGEKAGLLAGIMEKGLNLSPREYYVASLCRCRPADGEDPAARAALCAPVLRRELALLRPRVVLALGSGPGRLLSGSADPVGLLRARSHRIEGLDGVWLRVTFGLSHMLGHPEIKKEAWKDLQKIIPGLNKMKQV